MRTKEKEIYWPKMQHINLREMQSTALQSNIVGHAVHLLRKCEITVQGPREQSLTTTPKTTRRVVHHFSCFRDGNHHNNWTKYSTAKQKKKHKQEHSKYAEKRKTSIKEAYELARKTTRDKGAKAKKSYDRWVRRRNCCAVSYGC